MNNNEIENVITNETKKRLNIMKNDDYKWPKKVNDKDYILIVLLFMICLLLIICCLIGAIE